MLSLLNLKTQYNKWNLCLFDFRLKIQLVDLEDWYEKKDKVVSFQMTYQAMKELLIAFS